MRAMECFRKYGHALKGESIVVNGVSTKVTEITKVGKTLLTTEKGPIEYDDDIELTQRSRDRLSRMFPVREVS